MALVAIDFETASGADLKKVGAWRYSQHPSTRVWCAVLGWRRPDGSVETLTWEPGDPIPEIDVDTWLAHNSTFERCILKHILVPQFGWPTPKLWQDTQAHAAAANLPITLEGLGNALAGNTPKDMPGHNLMMKMSWLYLTKEGVWQSDHDTPENRQRLREYCAQDVVATLDAWDRVPKMSEEELALWRLDQAINERGIYLDQAFVANMLEMTWERKKFLQAQALVETEFIGVTGTARLKEWLKSNDVDLPMHKRIRANGEEHESESTARNVLLELASAVETDPAVKRVIDTRLEIAKTTSLAKLRRVEHLVDPKDGRLRNSLQFCAAHTGRWASRGLQIHNLPRGGKGWSSDVTAAVMSGDLGSLTKLTARPLDALSAHLRGIISAAPGHDLIGADFSAIEARVLAWLSGQQDVLEVLADPSRDLYTEDAKTIGSDNRQLGKVCIAEGELVLTDHGLVPIERVQLHHRVWDGIEWVTHDGPILQGTRVTVCYDGLTATPDHVVWCADGSTATLGECLDAQIPLATTGSGRQAVRFGADRVAADSLEGPRQPGAPAPLPRSEGSVREVQHRSLDRSRQPVSSERGRVSALWATATGAEVAQCSDAARQGAVYQPGSPVLPGLWSAGCSVQLPVGAGCSGVGAEESGAAEGSIARSHRQQRPLRAGQSAVGDLGYPGSKQAQQQVHPLSWPPSADRGCVPPFQASAPRRALRRHDAAEPAECRQQLLRDSGEVAHIEVAQATRRVWDLLNCGPRHRFTVSGKLVSNCRLGLGYGMGPVKFASTAANPPYRIVLPLKEARRVVLSWRRANPAIVDLWRNLEDACVTAIRNPGAKAINVGPFLKVAATKQCLMIRLPSGRTLRYWRPHIMQTSKTIQTVNEAGEIEEVKRDGQEIRFFTAGSNAGTMAVEHTYGGKCAEHASQAVARDLLAAAVARLDAHYPVVGHVHDSIVAEVPEGTGSVEEFCEIMAALPPWAVGLPMKAEGYRDRRFRG